MTILIDFARGPGDLQIEAISLRVDGRPRADAIRAAIGYAQRNVALPVERVMISGSEDFLEQSVEISAEEVLAACA